MAKLLMECALFVGIATLVLSCSGRAWADGRTFTVRTALERLWNLSLLPDLRPEKLRMASSGAVYPWAKDGSEFLYRESNGEYVIFDATGPGCLVRYWSALIEEGTRIRFFFDGNTKPEIDMPLKDLFTGERYPWMLPVVGNADTSSGGFYSYLPIPYAKGCKVTLDRLPSFYHLESLNVADYEEIETFGLARCEHYRADIEKAAAALESRGFPDEAGGDVSRSSGVVGSGESFPLAAKTGAGEIEWLTLAMEPCDPDTLRHVLLRAFWDGEASPSVWSPVGDFFVSGHRKTTFTSLALGSTDRGFYCRFPMPFRTGARIEIVNEGPRAVNITASMLVRPLDSLSQDRGRFHARWSRIETQIGQYVPLLTTRGRGRYVGISFNCQAISPWMLEGDEVVWADGELTPSVHGTGTEDYFNGAWYFNRGQFGLATHGAPLLELTETGKRSRVSLYRLHTLDPIYFSERIRLCIEHGQELSMQGSDYCFTTFWYQDEPHIAPFPMPAASERAAVSARVLRYIEQFAAWQEAQTQNDDAAVAERGLRLLDEFPGEANLNMVRYQTGSALQRLGRVNEAIEAWRSAEDYLGVDYRETGLCKAEAWIARGARGKCPKSLLEIPRIDSPQNPGAFDSRKWEGLPVATGFHPHFPSPYLDLPSDHQTEVAMSYDMEYVYARARCFEPKTKQLVVGAIQDKLDMREDTFAVCFDSARKYDRYAFIACNSKGRVKAAMTAGLELWSGQQAVDASFDAEAAARIEDGAWIVELRIHRRILGLEGGLAGRICGLEFIRIRNVDLEKSEASMWGGGYIPIIASEFSLGRFGN